MFQCGLLRIGGMVTTGTGFVSVPALFRTGGGFCCVLHQIMLCGQLFAGGIAAADAAVVSVPADFRTGGGFCSVAHQVVTAVVTPFASGALSLRGAGRATVAAAECGLIVVAAIASVAVHIHVDNGRPRAPVVTENAVFRAAFFTGFALGAGERSGAAAAAFILNCVAVAALAAAGVRAVAVRRPRAPVVTENAIFRPA